MPSLLLFFATWLFSLAATACDLHQLLDQNEYAAISECVEQGADPNQLRNGNAILNRYQTFTLTEKSLKNEAIFRMVSTLIDAGADVNAKNQAEFSPFENLLRRGDYPATRPLVLKMLKQGANMNAIVPQYDKPEKPITPLLWSIKYQQNEAFDWLIDNGVDLTLKPNATIGSLLAHALYYQNQHAFSRLVSLGQTFSESADDVWELALRSPYHEAMIDHLIRSQIRPASVLINDKHNKALFDHIHTIENVSLLTKVLDYLQFQEQPPYSLIEYSLVYNARLRKTFDQQQPNRLLIMRHWIKSGSNLKWYSEKKHNSLLQIVAEPNYVDLEVAKLLIEAGAPVNHTDVDGDTPLHQIAFNLEKLYQEKATLTDAKPQNRFSKEGDVNEILGFAFGTSAKIDPRIINQKHIDELHTYYQLLKQHGAKDLLKNKAGQTPKALMSKLPKI